MSTARSPMVSPCADVPPGDGNVTHEAYLRVLERAKALPDDRKQNIITDVAAAIVRARAALPAILAFREAMLALPGFDIAALDQFDDTSRAMLAVDLQRRSFDSARRDALVALAEECARIRAIAIADALPLVSRGALSDAELESIKDGQGRDDLSRDLLRLAAIFESVRASGAVTTAVTTDEIALMRKKAEALREAVERSDDGDAAQREVSDLRARMYTLFVDDWSQLRRAITFLRWREGDADTIAPSLFLKGKRGANNSNSDGKSEPSKDKPPAPGPDADKDKDSAAKAALAPSPFIDASRPVPQDEPFAARR